MNNGLIQAVESKTIEYFKENIIQPLLDGFISDYDERCYKIFTKELAELFEEYLPEYFSSNHYEKVGQYFFSSLYDDYVPEEMLIEIIKADQHEDFEGLKIYFEDFRAINTYVENMINDHNSRFDFFNELLIIVTLENLNKQC